MKKKKYTLPVLVVSVLLVAGAVMVFAVRDSGGQAGTTMEQVNPDGTTTVLTPLEEVENARELFEVQDRTEKLIRAMDGVEDAAVIISIPEEDEPEYEPAAAVMVTMAEGQDLSEKQRAEVRRELMKAVDDLREDYIAIIDADSHAEYTEVWDERNQKN